MSMTIGPEVQIEAGVVRCVPRDDRGVLAFKGIPFADPPVGDLRWHAPQPQARSGMRDATSGFGLASVCFWLFCRLVAQSYQMAESVEK